jgi:hypothetical protein
MNKGAVITADIVHSTRLSKADYKKLLKNLSLIFEQYPHEFFRGDSFQVFVKLPADALQLILLVRTLVIKSSSVLPVAADVRATIGIGSVKLPVKSLNTASGEAFILSGRTFDKLQKDQRLVIVCDEKNHVVNIALRIISQFTDYIFEKLTVKQAAVVFELLQGKTQTETAKRLKKSQATIHKHIQSAGWPELEELIKNYKELLKLIEP